MKKIYLLLVSFIFGLGALSAQNSVTFNYTGSMQTWVVPPCVTQITVTLDAGSGGSGGETSNSSQDIGGLAGEVIGVLPVTTGTTLNIFSAAKATAELPLPEALADGTAAETLRKDIRDLHGHILAAAAAVHPILELAELLWQTA